MEDENILILEEEDDDEDEAMDKEEETAETDAAADAAPAVPAVPDIPAVPAADSYNPPVPDSLDATRSYLAPGRRRVHLILGLQGADAARPAHRCHLR